MSENSVFLATLTIVLTYFLLLNDQALTRASRARVSASLAELLRGLGVRRKR